MMSDTADPATEAFVAHRNLLFTVAYEMLGSAADAEDVLQETWLRWVEVDLDRVRDPRAYLVRITTRQALNRLRAMQRRREAYIGPWLPEPVLTAPDVADDVALAESVSMALMLVLETLAPTERAVFVLREVFDVGYDEIAAAVGKTPEAVRQIAHRARRHVDARRPRGVATPAETRAALASMQRALETGDLQGLIDVLAPDVVVIGDGGGFKHAALRPVVGADKAARMFFGGLAKLEATVTAELTVINGGPALIVHLDGELDGVMAARIEDGRITGVYYVRNPEKLSHLASATTLTLRLSQPLGDRVEVAPLDAGFAEECREAAVRGVEVDEEVVHRLRVGALGERVVGGDVRVRGPRDGQGDRGEDAGAVAAAVAVDQDRPGRGLGERGERGGDPVGGVVDLGAVVVGRGRVVAGVHAEHRDVPVDRVVPERAREVVGLPVVADVEDADHAEFADGGDALRGEQVVVVRAQQRPQANPTALQGGAAYVAGVDAVGKTQPGHGAPREGTGSGPFDGTPPRRCRRLLALDQAPVAGRWGSLRGYCSSSVVGARSESVTSSAHPSFPPAPGRASASANSALTAFTMPGPCSASIVAHRPSANVKVY
jgi:RNA polymerase sigma-70 factor (ECF subfamily)